MICMKKTWLLASFLMFFAFSGSLSAQKLTHSIQDKSSAKFLEDAAGLLITDKGQVLVTSTRKGTLLVLENEKFKHQNLKPSIFKKTALAGIAQMADGSLVIANAKSNQIAITDEQAGKLIRVFSKSGGDAGEIKSVMGVSVSINNRIYVADKSNNRISVFNEQGLYFQQFGHEGKSKTDLSKPTHIALDAEENVYVLEAEAKNRLSIFTSKGILIKQIKAKELAKLFGKSIDFSAMTADLNGRLYLADDNSRKIFVYDWKNNQILSQFGSLGQSRGQYRSIDLLSVNVKGQLAVLDKVNEKVEIYQLEETTFKQAVKTDVIKFSDKLKSKCKSVHAFIGDQTLCIRKGNKGIVVLSPDGKQTGVFASELKKPTALHSGRQMVAILEKNMLHTYTHAGKKIYSIGRYGIAEGGFDGPKHVFSAHNRVYVSDNGNNRVQVFGGDGQFIKQLKSSDKSFTKIGPLAVDNQQQLYLVDQGNKGFIKVFDADFNLIREIGSKEETAYTANRIHAIDIDQKDRLFALISNEVNDYSIRMFDQFEQVLGFGSGASNGTDVYFDKIGSLSVASTDKVRILVNDTGLKEQFRFDYLEYPDAAFGLQVVGNKMNTKLNWSSSLSPVIAGYEIQAAMNESGPFSLLATTKELTKSLSSAETKNKPWFRIVSVSGYQLRAKPSAVRENQFYKLQQLHHDKNYKEAIILADRLLKKLTDKADILELKADSQLLSGQQQEAISTYRQLEQFAHYKKLAISQQVKAYYELEQYLDAKSLVDQVLETKPEDVDPYLICTDLSIHLSDAIGAVSCAEDGLILHSKNVELRYLLAKAYILAGIEDQGLIEYQSVLDDQPQNHKIRLNIANDLLDMKRYEQALDEFNIVLQAQPSSAQASIGKATSLLKLDRDDEAKAIAIKLSAKTETKADGYYVLGKIALKQQKYTEAILRLTRASKVKPENIDVWVSMASAYIELNKPGKAMTGLKQGINSNPESFELQLLAGQIELNQENYNEATVYLDKAVTLNAQSLLANTLYAQNLYATRNFRSASNFAENAAKIAPKDIDVLTLQADIASQLGKVASAIEYLKTAISLQPGSAELQHKLGTVYLNANLFDASTEHLQKAAAINPSWAEPNIGLGKLYSKRRLFDEAIGFFEKAVELNPSENNRALLNTAFSDKKKSLEFKNNAPQLVLTDLNLKHVFSAAYKKYANQSLGSVNLKNVGATDYGNLELSFQIKEYMDFPLVQTIPAIKGNERQQFDFQVTFNNKILEVDEDIGVQVEVKLSFLRDGKKDSIRLIQPMTIYGKNAMVWGDSNMVGSFVTPKDDTLRDYVRTTINNFQPAIGPLNDKLVSTMTYFSSLSAAGTKYIVDPNTPYTSLRDNQVDYVQFPRETLKLKSGDCDDLSVLLSAGLENLGIETAFIEVPGHLFMMFNTGLTEDESSLISQDRSLLAIRNNQVWIPLEATMVNSSFNEAWAEGARKYHKAVAENNLGIIDLKQAWKHYKPVTLKKSRYTIEYPDKERAYTLVKIAHTELLSKSINRLILPYQSMIENNPTNITARMQIAILYSRYGLYDDAQLVFDDLHELAPENSAVHSNQGNLYLLAGKFDNAVSSYKKAISKDQNDGGIWVNLSMASYRMGDLKSASTQYQQAISLTPELKDSYSAYSKLLSQ